MLMFLANGGLIVYIIAQFYLFLEQKTRNHKKREILADKVNTISNGNINTFKP